MVGDSLANDVDGPAAAGLRGIWLNRTGEPRPADREDLVEIAGLDELEKVLADTT
jgi:putative hydrolase of the HAD superfamily